MLGKRTVEHERNCPATKKRRSLYCSSSYYLITLVTLSVQLYLTYCYCLILTCKKCFNSYNYKYKLLRRKTHKLALSYDVVEDELISQVQAFKFLFRQRTTNSLVSFIYLFNNYFTKYFLGGFL